MTTQIICDRCEAVVYPKDSYILGVKDFTADLCINCAAAVQSFVEQGDTD